MIKNWDFHSLHMDFSSMYKGNDHPSDIDMVYLGRNKFLIIAEIKHERGTFTVGQRHLLETLIDGWKFGGMVIYVNHDRMVQHGDTDVDVSECFVKEYYIKGTGRWEKPVRPVQVKQVIEKFRGVKI